MDYRKYGETYYARMDKGDEIISCILALCRNENISSAIFSGIGGCSGAEIQTFIPQDGMFETQTLAGMLELVSLNGNIVTDEKGNYYHHTRELFLQGRLPALYGCGPYPLNHCPVHCRD